MKDISVTVYVEVAGKTFEVLCGDFPGVLTYERGKLVAVDGEQAIGAVEYPSRRIEAALHAVRESNRPVEAELPLFSSCGEVAA